MYRRPKFDLEYTHDPVAPVRQSFRGGRQRPTPSDLTARLRGLKALFDIERESRFGAAAHLGRAR